MTTTTNTTKDTFVRSYDSPFEFIGKRVESAMDWRQALKEAEVDWTVSVKPLYLADASNGGGAPVAPVFDSVESFFDCHRLRKFNAIVRDDMDPNDDPRAVLGVVGRNYNPLQNRDAFQLIDGLLEGGHAEVHAAGTLRKGRTVFMCAKLKDSIEPVNGDLIDKYLFLTNSFDGSGSVRVHFIGQRIVCSNMVRAAMRDATAKVSARHTATVHTRIRDRVRQLLVRSDAVFGKYADFLRALSERAWTHQQMQGMAEVIWPANDEGEVSTNRLRQRQRLVDLYHGGRGQELVGVQGTALAAYNALTEYATWERPTKGNATTQLRSRIEGSMFGEGNKLVEQGVKVLTGVTPLH